MAGTGTGSRFIVNIPVDPAPHGIRRQQQVEHTHRDFAGLRAHLLASALSSPVKAHVVGIFTVLATAEGKIHGMAPEEVSFHELGEWDSIADIVGAAFLIDALGADGWTVGTLPLGAGFVPVSYTHLTLPTKRIV